MLVPLPESSLTVFTYVHRYPVLFIDDHNYIPLIPLEDYTDCQGDFINACYIDVKDKNSQAIIQFKVIYFPNNRGTQNQKNLLLLKVRM